MDELSLLLDDSTVESALPSLEAPDFTGSLSYIDSLASRSALAFSQRDILAIATASSATNSGSADQSAVLGEDLSSISTDFRPLGDARRFNPEGFTAPLGLSRSSFSLVSPSIHRSMFPDRFVNPLDPSRDVGDLNRTFTDIERRVSRRPFAFRQPSRVVTCLKRKIRRQVMASLNFPYRPWPFTKRRSNAFSRVIC